MAIDADMRWQLFTAMLTLRRIEERLIEAYHPADEMRCPVHFCVGQEAAPAALGLCMQAEDSLFTHYRSHGYFLAKGGSLDAMVAEFHGKDSGANRGLAGSMELADHDTGHYSGAIVGGPMAIAVGDAFARRYRNDPGATITVFGDGSLDEGVAFESLNLAALHALPILFVCEDNGYAAHTGPAVRRKGDIKQRVEAFGIPHHRISDKNPESLASMLADARDSASNNQPLFVEVETYRFCAHVGPDSDDGLAYRSDEEINAALENDPLENLKTTILANGRSADEISSLEQAIDRDVASAIEKARAAPFPTAALMHAAASADSASNVLDGLPDYSGVAAFQAGQEEARLEPY